MSPLFKRHVLASELDNFLSNQTTEHGSLGGDRTSTVGSNISNDGLINLFNIDEIALLERGIDMFGVLNYFDEVCLNV